MDKVRTVARLNIDPAQFIAPGHRIAEFASPRVPAIASDAA
jgi:hypothetical protein